MVWKAIAKPPSVEQYSLLQNYLIGMLSHIIKFTFPTKLGLGQACRICDSLLWLYLPDHQWQETVITRGVSNCWGTTNAGCFVVGGLQDVHPWARFSKLFIIKVLRHDLHLWIQGFPEHQLFKTKCWEWGGWTDDKLGSG